MFRTVARTAATLVTGVAIVVAGANAASAAPAAPAAPLAAESLQAVQTTTLTPVALHEFTWVSGQQQWAQPSAERLVRSAFQLDDAGNFVMYQPDGYPTLVGTFNPDGTFQAAYASTAGDNGATTAEVMGQLVLTDDAVFMELTYVSGATLAAVVNGSEFGNSRVKAYFATLELGVV